MRYRGAFLLLSGGYRGARRERLAHAGQGLREEGLSEPTTAVHNYCEIFMASIIR